MAQIDFKKIKEFQIINKSEEKDSNNQNSLHHGSPVFKSIQGAPFKNVTYIDITGRRWIKLD